jgi:hypothetical protein
MVGDHTQLMRICFYSGKTFMRACLIVAFSLGAIARASDFGGSEKPIWEVSYGSSGERWVLFSAPPNSANTEAAMAQHLIENGILLTGNGKSRSIAADTFGSIKGVFSNPSGLYSVEFFVRPNMNRLLLLDLRADGSFILETSLKVTRVDSGAVITWKNEKFAGNFRLVGGRVELLFSKSDNSCSLQLEREGNDLITCNKMRLRYRAHGR